MSCLGTRRKKKKDKGGKKTQTVSVHVEQELKGESQMAVTDHSGDESFDVSRLENAKRGELQKLCKKAGLKANGKVCLSIYYDGLFLKISLYMKMIQHSDRSWSLLKLDVRIHSAILNWVSKSSFNLKSKSLHVQVKSKYEYLQPPHPPPPHTHTFGKFWAFDLKLSSKWPGAGLIPNQAQTSRLMTCTEIKSHTIYCICILLIRIHICVITVVLILYFKITPGWQFF